MAAWLDACRFVPTAGGTTDWTYSGAVVIGYQGPGAAGVVNGRVYKYRAESADLSQWELGEGAYNTSTGVLARTTILFSSTGAKVNFSTVPQVAIVALKEDMISIEEANTFTSTQQDQARVNILSVGVVRVQKFTASGTYTPNANMLYCTIECVGGGGGGGGCAGAAGSIYSGGGGGSGGYSRLMATAATIGASKAVTIGAAGAAGTAGGTTPTNNGGAGGDTSVGTLCIGKGGSGGVCGSGGSAPNGGAGGVAGTGDLVAAGNGGFCGSNAATLTVFNPSGNGGSSYFGGAAQGVSNAAAIAGATAGNYGSGGSGGSSYNTTSTAAGGAGSAGLVIVTEFCTK